MRLRGYNTGVVRCVQSMCGVGRGEVTRRRRRREVALSSSGLVVSCCSMSVLAFWGWFGVGLC